jgi:hypothetical protein
MPKRRTSKHRGALNEYESAWLEGDEHGWLVGLNPDDVLQALWDRAGIAKTFFGKLGCTSLNRLPTDPSILRKSWPWLAAASFAC